MSHEEFLKWIENSPKEHTNTIEELEATFNIEVEHAMSHLADCVPYGDPHYKENLRKIAENYVKEMWDPNSQLNKICGTHDKALEERKIDN